MAVNLSPVGGVAGQFFDNNGNPLAGGKLYTYTAGTTTPQVTYTSSSGATANSNPIILNSGGRVPSEIWLTDGLSYKFVLYTSTDTLIGTWDNISGINSNFVNFTNSQEIQTATAGQTVFTLATMEYQPGTNSMTVYVDGVNQYGPGALYAYVETNSTTITFNSGLHVGAEVKFTTSAQNTSSATDASQISYEPAGTGAVTTNVQAKLRETVSVKDFGAVGDGVTDDSQAFLDAYAANTSYYIPSGNYAINSSTVDVNSHQFFSSANVTLTIDAVAKDYSNCFFGSYQLAENGDWAVDSQKYMDIFNRFSDKKLARISSAFSSSDSHQVYLPIEVFRDSHGFMLRHGTVGGTSDILFQDSTSTDMFYLISNGDAANCSFSILFDTTPGTGGGFDSAFTIAQNAGVPKLSFPAAPVEMQQPLTFVRRSAPTYKWKFQPDAASMTLKSQDTSDVDQATLMTFDRYSVNVANKKFGVVEQLPFSGRIVNSFSSSGSINVGAPITFPIVAASHLAIGTIKVLFIGSGGGETFYKADFKFDGTTLTVDTSTINSANAQLTVSFSVVSSQVELTLNYLGGIGGTSRYSVDVDVNTANR